MRHCSTGAHTIVVLPGAGVHAVSGTITISLPAVLIRLHRRIIDRLRFQRRVDGERHRPSSLLELPGARGAS